MNEKEWLDSLLNERSKASLEDIANAIRKLQSDDAKYYPAIFSPVQLATDSYWSGDLLWGIWSCHYYVIASMFSLSDSDTFWHIIEMLPSHSICRELVYLVFRSAVVNGNLDQVLSSVPHCIEHTKWNGCHSVIYALQTLCDLSDEGDLRFGDAIIQFLSSRKDEEKQAFSIIAYSIILCSLCGDLTPKLTGRQQVDTAKATHISLIQTIAEKMSPCLKSTSPKLLNILFGLDIRHRQKEIADSIETGQILKSNGSNYALALSVIDALGIELPDHYIIHLAERCILFADKSFRWVVGDEESPASIHIANLLSKTSNPNETWDSVITAWRPAIRRRLFYRDDDSNCGTHYALIPIFIATSRHLVNYWANDHKNLAFSIWHESWKVGCMALRGYEQSILLSRNMEKLASMFLKLRPHEMSKSEEYTLLDMLPYPMPESYHFGYNRDRCILLFHSSPEATEPK